MTIEQIREKMSDRNLREVARRTGVSYWTLYRLSHKDIAISEQVKTVLIEYLQK